MSLKKSFLILLTILLISSLCGTTEALIPNQQTETVSTSTSPYVTNTELQITQQAEQGSNTITFSEFPLDTYITDQYSNRGIIFGGDSPFISMDGSSPTSPVLSGTPQFYGAIEGRFVNPVDGITPIAVPSFSLEAGGFNNVGSTRLEWFDRYDNKLGEQVNSSLGFENFVIEGYGTSRWRIAIISSELAGFAIDNLRINSGFKLELSKTDDVNDDDCVGLGNEITYTINYSYPAEPNYFGYKSLADLHEWWLCGCDFNNNDCNGIDIDKDGTVNFTDFATLAGNWLNGQVINDVNIIDYLPAEADFISASNGGIYDSNSHAVRWEIGTLEPDYFGSVTLIIKVNPCTQLDETITNYCEIKSGDVLYSIAYEYTPVCWASDPKPTCGEMEVPQDVNLSWKPGPSADKHDVYLGTDYIVVKYANDPNTPPGGGRQDSNSYDPCETFDSDTTYYWRIDEVNDQNVWKGVVWWFRTSNWLSVDDFDSYADTDKLDDIWQVNAIWNIVALETATVRSGNSMRYSYENWSYPFFAEAEVDTFDLPSGIGTDWTIGGSEALALYFYGEPNNDANEQMYVKLTDGSSHSAIVLYDGDANDVKDPNWHQWNIALADFAGVDMNDVRHLILGFGDGVYQATDIYEASIVYFDDIRLYPPRCIQSIAGDLTCDCVVDYSDLKIMTDQWLDTNYCCEANIYKDSNVNFMDFAILADNWLEEGQLWPE